MESPLGVFLQTPDGLSRVFRLAAAINPRWVSPICTLVLWSSARVTVAFSGQPPDQDPFPQLRLFGLTAKGVNTGGTEAVF